MKIFYGFLVILVSVGLFLLPITDASYDFRTDVKEDIFRYETTAGVTTANVTLIKSVYDNDQSTISITSDDSDDIPVVVEYHSTSRLLDISGLIESNNRTLTVAYDIDALTASDALSNLIDKVGWFWLICIVCFPIAAIVSLLLGLRK